MKRPRHTPGPLRRLVFREADHRCAWCGATHDLTVSHVESWPDVVKRLEEEGWPTDWESVYKTEFHQPANVIAQCRPCHSDYEAGRISRHALQQRRCQLAFAAARRGIYQDYLWSELAQRGKGRSNLDALGKVVLWASLSYADGALAEPHRFIIAPDHRPCDAFHLHVDLPRGRMSACAGLPCGRFEVWSPAERIKQTFRKHDGDDE